MRNYRTLCTSWLIWIWIISIFSRKKWDFFLFKERCLSQMPHIYEQTLRELRDDLSEAFLCWIAIATIVWLFIHWITVAYMMAFVNRTICLLYAACMLTFTSPCLSGSNFQLYTDSLSFTKTWLFLFTPTHTHTPTPHRLPFFLYP